MAKGYILKEGPVGFLDGLNVGCKRERVKGDAVVWCHLLRGSAGRRVGSDRDRGYSLGAS